MLAEVVRERGSLTQETLSLMWRFIRKDMTDPAVQRAALAVAGRGTPQEQAARVYAWVRANITYRPDPPNAELVQDLEASLRTRGGDCDDLATAAGTLLAAVGHRVVPVAVWWKDRPRFTHAVLEDKTAGLIVDPVSPVFQPWPPAGYGREVYALMEASL